MLKEEKVGVYIGRFQMIHKGHVDIIQKALKQYDRLIVLVGSAEIARDPKNPFTFEERKNVLDSIIERLLSKNLKLGQNKLYNILPIHDYIYDNTKWLSEVQLQVKNVTSSKDITIIGCLKDESSEYLKFFPQWKNKLETSPICNKTLVENRNDKKSLKNSIIHASKYRQDFFNGIELDPEIIPEEMIDFTNKFKILHKEIYDNLVKENEFILNYREIMNKTLKYPTMVFMTGDALVVCAGHVLLVRRKVAPGKGLLALPGGFVNGNKDKTLVDTAIRELKEETKIKVDKNTLLNSIKNKDLFEDPSRSLRWRIITQCIHIQLPYKDLPVVQGADDAEYAFWMPISELLENRDQMFEDHLSIIDTFLNVCNIK